MASSGDKYMVNGVLLMICMIVRLSTSLIFIVPKLPLYNSFATACPDNFSINGTLAFRYALAPTFIQWVDNWNIGRDLLRNLNCDVRQLISPSISNMFLTPNMMSIFC